jgi:AcrR family transcriptional regulator
MEGTKDGKAEVGSAERILAAGMHILEEEGYEALSMRKVGSAVGLSQAAIYRHYKDKAELVSRIIETGYGDLVALSAIPEGGAEGPEGLLASGIRHYFRFAMERPQLFKAVLLEDIGPAGHDVAVLSAGVSVRRRTFANLVELLERGMASDAFGKADPEITAQALWASMFGLAARLVIESARPGGAGRAGEVIDRQIDLLLAGLRAR